MIDYRHLFYSPLKEWRWRWLLVAIMAMLTTTVQAADWVKDSSKYSMSNSKDHVTFNVFLCDLDNNNTYPKKGGIYAKNSSGRQVWLMDLWYISEGSDENAFGKVRARYCVGESRAWFTNGYGQQEQEIGFNSKDYLLRKWGSKNHYLTANIDFYYPASMAGQSWTFYYSFDHCEGGSFTMTLGTATLSNTMGLSHFDTSNYTVERNRPDKIKFTVPALPDDVEDKLKEVHIHEGKYIVKFTYRKQDNTNVETLDTLECQKSNSKSYDIEIPEDVGNPKQIDMMVKATDGLRDAKNYYWKVENSYYKSNIFQTVPIPGNLTAEYRQFDKAADLSWNAYPTGSDNILECKPYIYRVETDKSGEPLNGSWSRRGTNDNAGTRQIQGYSDNNVQQGKFYKYMVLNVPKKWIGNGINESSLNNPNEQLLNQLGYVESAVLDTKPVMRIYNLQQDTTMTDKVKLTWQYSRVPTSTSSVKFKVMRKTESNGEWVEYGDINGESEPKSGTTLSFEDANLPDVSTRYDYKVRVTIGDYEFESDPISAGLLSGSQVKTFEATKGVHEGTVRLTWTSKQVGTEPTSYDISRRYIGSSDFIKINTTSGTTARFTYEDNTVQPGFYYEYKIEAYSGDVKQNTLTDVGFSLARGVVSGRVTYGSGSSVEDVRITLKASDTGDGNMVRGYAQHVDGASTGIAWNADTTAVNKVFGTDKDYTVQMFVRPGDELKKGAVLGEIPNMGRLILGDYTESGYQLLIEKHAYTDTDYTYHSFYEIREIPISSLGTQPGSEGYNIMAQWTEEGFSRYPEEGFIFYDVEHGLKAMLIFYKNVALPEPITTSKVSTYQTGLTLPANVYSLVTFQNKNQKIKLAVGEQWSDQLSLVSETTTSDNEDFGGYELFHGSLCSFEGSLSDYCKNNKPEVYDNICVEKGVVSSWETRHFSVGGAYGLNSDKKFKGELTEVRVWDHSLTEKEHATYIDRVLNGRENGLVLYWPMDEGLNGYVFDSSYSNDVPNGRHATVGSNISVSNIIPSDYQLSRYAITNDNGEYIIRGIPFVGSGSTYSVMPSRGIHEFSPASRNGFIGNGNLTLNSYDFTDVSSFPLRGKVTYLNTNIPSDSIQFKIDGALVQSKDKMVMSDANGEYEISVPIGHHLIEAYKDGHRLTSFPIDGTTYEFKRAETYNFTDSTLVNVTGRINGGFTDQTAPLGFHQSVNRIGKATIKLSLGKESQCSFNYIVDEHGSGSFGTTDIPVASATDSIQSTAYRAGGEHDDTYYIYITTDEKTGEFSALLPPLKYKVESIRFKGGTDYDNEPVFAQNLPMIDATNTVDSKMGTDSLFINGEIKKYEYAAKMIRQYRSSPDITVTQAGMKNGAFGNVKVPVRTLQNEPDTLEVLTYTDKGYAYRFGHPLFLQRGTYDFDIDIAENYRNLDTDETFAEIPRDAVVNIMNDASILATVLAEKTIIDGNEVEAGAEIETPNFQVVPDSLGHVSYSFIGGWPNLAEGHIRNLSIGVTIDGRTMMWQAPGSQTDALDLILLGNLPTGTNFMSDGPDKVDYVVRRPPGSTSVASYEQMEVTAYGTTSVIIDDDTWGGGAYVSLSPTWKIDSGTGNGFFSIMHESKSEIIANENITRVNGTRDADYITNETKYTLSEKVTTPNFIPYSILHGAYKPESGDTYIGHATNQTFSKARTLGIFQNSDGEYELKENEGITMAETFKTSFVYTQEYIEDYLIPNWKALIEDRLIHVNGNHWDKNNPEVKEVAGEVRYYTSYNPEDEEYGRANGDPKWKDLYKQRNGWPSYRMVNGKGEPVEDEVEHAINQIIAWESTMGSNEEDKLKAFNDNTLEDNRSISGGTTYSQTSKTEKSSSSKFTHMTYHTINSETHFGYMFNDAGAYGIYKQTWYEADETDKNVSASESTSISWTLSDSDPRTALSVDVYKSPKGWGPIFRTRAGQTVNPYEGETRTLYCGKDEKLNEATMRVELPQLLVQGSSEQTDIPTGGEAKFILQLKNNSETNSMSTYILEVLEASNPNGAKLMMDGVPLGNGHDGRSVKIAGGATIEKMLLVSQGSRSITDYKDITLVLRSEKDRSTKSDPLTLSVHFVPASAHIDLAVDHTVLNKVDKDLYKGVTAKMYNINRKDEGLQGVRLRFRRKGTDSWNIIKQWSQKEEDLAMGYEAMPSGSEFTQQVLFTDDGLYELQAQSFGMYGNAEVTFESNIIEITQDTHGPQVLGMISPESGLLTYLNRNDMHLRFNELLNVNALSKSDNFEITGGLNNVVAGGLYPDVAVQLNGERIETEATYLLSNSDYAFGLWFYRQGDGTIISMGTDNNLLSLATHDGGLLSARVGTEEDVYDAQVTLPENQWIYMALNYKRKTESDPENRLTMLYATADDTQPTYVGRDVPAKDLNGHGKLSIGGDGMIGMVSDLSIWNSDKTATELFLTRKQVRAPYTEGLVGYWRMDEGHGTQLTDRARSRHMHMPAESWYINNENLAAHVDEDHPMTIDISTFSPGKSDNYAVELWFRGSREQNDRPTTTLLSVLNGLNVSFADGGMVLSVINHSLLDGVDSASVVQEERLSDKDYLDNNWHHFALNVRRGTSAIAYIDGDPVKVIPENIIPGISAHYLVLGGRQTLLNVDGHENLVGSFVGDFDDVRIWSAALDGRIISERMYERMNNRYSGLVGYFPMEEINRTPQGKVQTQFSTANFGEQNSQLKITSQLTMSENAPALKPGSSRMRLDDSQFDFTASSNEIFFSFRETSLPQMDNNDFLVTVMNIKDDHNNNSEPVEWVFHTDFASVAWYDNIDNYKVSVNTLTKSWDSEDELYVPIYNKTGVPQTYEISGLPTWMSVDKPVGTITGEKEWVTFFIHSTVPVGRYTEYIYLTDRLGIRRVMQINLTVTGDEPLWTVNPDLFESNMTLTGQIYIDDKICENPDTKIAAFDKDDVCRGVASPAYVASRDAYFVDMVIYGGAATELSSAERDLTFKMYDASTGGIDPIVLITIPGKDQEIVLRYVPDANYGSYNAPVTFRTSGLLEEPVALNKGWNWMSIYVNPVSTELEYILPTETAVRKRFKNIKGKTEFATINSSGQPVGELTNIYPGSMYKMQLSANTDFAVYGVQIDAARTPQTIRPGYNWIGPLSSSILSVDDAFADLGPVPGDRVKSREGFAEYSSKGYWEGTLKNIVPGAGYIYHSLAADTRSFCYPSHTGSNTNRASDVSTVPMHFIPNDTYLYPDNMNIIAVVKKDGVLRDDAEIGAFVGDECRGAVAYNSGYYFLTIMGSSENDAEKHIELRVFIDGQEYSVDKSLMFFSDAFHGSLDAPYVLDVDVTAIRSIAGDDADDDDDWYTLQGVKMDRRPTQQGVYIHHGKKVTVLKVKGSK